jgi:hypothetical protein
MNCGTSYINDGFDKKKALGAGKSDCDYILSDNR